MNDKLIIGSHISLNAPEYFLGAAKEALKLGENTFMFYTGAPQNTVRKSVSEMKIDEGIKFIKENGIHLDKVVVHAPYIINLANTANPDIKQLAIDFLITELRRTNAFGVKTLILHPGSHVKMGEQVGLNQIVDSLNEVFSKDNTDVKVAIETMAGKGSELGRTMDEIKYIIDNVNNPERLGICLDTCHLFDSGIDLEHFDKYLDQFDKIIGIDRILCVHVNDSKNEIGSRKDRHENIGYGNIGFETLRNIVLNPRLELVPKILETPYVNGKPPYKEEITMLKNGIFNEKIKEL